VARCCGVDPSPAAVARLAKLHADLPNVAFVEGTASAVPFPDRTFDIVVINSVLQSLPSLDDIHAALRELVRVCKPGGTVFVGELPFQAERDKGILHHLARQARENGLANTARLLWTVYAKPALSGEPILTYPATNIFIAEDDFVAFCRTLGLTVESMRHRELRRPSTTRNDYWLRVP
jgi:SAM-dependent methyltransferase